MNDAREVVVLMFTGREFIPRLGGTIGKPFTPRSASTLRSVPAWIMTCQCFRGLPPSQSSSGFWPYRLSPGLAISALVCLDFAFHLLSSVISFSWRHLYLASAHVQTISTSSLWGITPSGTCVPLSTMGIPICGMLPARWVDFPSGSQWERTE